MSTCLSCWAFLGPLKCLSIPSSGIPPEVGYEVHTSVMGLGSKITKSRSSQHQINTFPFPGQVLEKIGPVAFLERDMNKWGRNGYGYSRRYYGAASQHHASRVSQFNIKSRLVYYLECPTPPKKFFLIK